MAADAALDRVSTDVDTGDPPRDLAQMDEEEASEARRRYRSEGIEPLEPDARIGPLLAPGEVVFAHHRVVALARRQRSKEIVPSAQMRGHLYVTSARLVHVGPSVLTIDLDDIEDAALAGELVLLIVRGGVGITLDSDRPRLLRVQMAAARAGRADPTRHRPVGPQHVAR